MSEFHNTGFDPLEHIIKMTNLLNEISDAHNRLAASHLNLEKEIVLCRQEIRELKRFLNLTQQ